MRVALTSLVLSVLAVSAEAHQHCITELNAHPGSHVSTVSKPAETATLYQNKRQQEAHPRAYAAPEARARTSTHYSLHYKEATKYATQVHSVKTFTPVNFIIRDAVTITKTAQAVVGTTTLYITTGPTGGTTTLTSYTLNVPAPSLAAPVLNRRQEIEARQSLDHSNHEDTEKSNGVDAARFHESDDNPAHNHGSKVYCSNVVTSTVAGPAPTAAGLPSPLARLAQSPATTVVQTIEATTTVTVYVSSTPTATVTARAVTSTASPKPVTVTYTPTTKVLTKTSYVPAAPTATVVVGGYDVCKPTKFSQLYDWTAYQAEALAFGVTTYANISDPASCCAAAASKPGALAWALCDDTNDLHESCQKGVKGPCFVTYLKTVAGYTTAQDQCQAGNNATTFQYRAGSGQIGGPLQCASTYQPYNCFRPVLLLLGDYVCLKA
ncbi:unnamed protein product [Tilletia controversa]|nr:unnamed protein product [Tilletia controversa]